MHCQKTYSERGTKMSIESAKAYLNRLKTDENFAKKVKGYEDKTARKDFVAKEGYSFTKEELEAVSSELSDGELDAVAGGGCVLDFCPIDW